MRCEEESGDDGERGEEEGLHGGWLNAVWWRSGGGEGGIVVVEVE